MWRILTWDTPFAFWKNVPGLSMWRWVMSVIHYHHSSPFTQVLLPPPLHLKVPSHDHNSMPGEALKHFQREVSALGLLGTPHYIHPDTPYFVYEEVQLVRKYLKALCVGGTRGIDRLYQEGKEGHFTSQCSLTHTRLHSWCPCSLASEVQL